MRLFAFVFLIVVAAAETEVATYFVPCECSDKSPVIPGANVIIGGFDVTQLAVNADRSFKSAVFEFSGGYRCFKNTNYDSECFVVPIELTLVDLDATKVHQVENLYETYYEHVSTFAESYTTSFKIGVPDLHMSVDYHAELYESQKLLSSGYSQMGYATYDQYMFTLIQPPAFVLRLDPTFERALSMLPSVNLTTEDNDRYAMFLEQYGGYYCTELVMGGGFHQNQYVTSNYVSTYSYTTTMHEMSVSFNAQMFAMTYGYWSNSTDLTTTDAYDANSETTMYCYGGDINALCGSEDWHASISAYPAYTNVSYAPMYLLVSDDAAKRDTLKAKIEDYTRTGVLAT